MFELNRLYNMDCMTAMQQIPNKFFELAICDPPYGIGIDGQKLNINKKNPKHTRKEHEKRNWDDAIPPEEYFRELERISANQILWGGNYFVEHLTKGTKGWIVWDKGQHGLTMSDCELAYTSFDIPTRIVVMNRVELLKDGTFHPTQKPVKLYTSINKDVRGVRAKAAVKTHRIQQHTQRQESSGVLYFKGMERLETCHHECVRICGYICTVCIA